MSLFKFIMDKIVYMDNAATTRLSASAFEAMLPWLKGDHYNPGAVYGYADNAKRAIASAREDIASTLGAEPGEIFFTCGGTESDNWALKGTADPARQGLLKMRSGNVAETGRVHMITSAIEHHAVLNPCKYLESCGVKVSYVKPDEEGSVCVSDIEKLICDDTVLISIMLANNELGTLQPVMGIGKCAHERGILFHTDAVAAYGHIPIDVKKMNIDMLSVSAHKFGGPKGTGFLYVNAKYRLAPFMHGGYQERGRRAGTENVAAIAGMAACALEHHNRMKENLERRNKLDLYFLGKLKEMDQHLNGYGGRKVKLNGPLIACREDRDGELSGRLPGSFNIMIPGMNAEEIIVRLGMEGICVSAGAACASSDNEASHVLTAIGLDRTTADSSIRITMNEDNTEEEIDILFLRLNKLLGLRGTI